MKFKNLFLCAALAIACVLPSTPARAADDATFRQTLTNAPAAGTNYSAVIDLGTASTSQMWRLGYVKLSVPALPNAVTTATNMSFTLQTSSDNSTWANTVPLIQANLAGVASTGTGATNFYLPLPPVMVKRYIRIAQGAPSTVGDNTAKTNTIQLVVP